MNHPSPARENINSDHSWIWSVTSLTLSLGSVACAQLAWQIWESTTQSELSDATRKTILKEKTADEKQKDDKKGSIERDERYSSWYTRTNRAFSSVGMALFTTVGCAALVSSTSSRVLLPVNNLLPWFSWGSGLWALHSLLNQQSQSTTKDSSSNWALYTLLYTTLIPPPFHAENSSAAHQHSNRQSSLQETVLPLLLLGIQLIGNQQSPPNERRSREDPSSEVTSDTDRGDNTTNDRATSTLHKRTTPPPETPPMSITAPPPLASHPPSTLSNKHNSTNSSSNTTSNKRYLEILVHNVSHTDLVLSLDTTRTSASPARSTVTHTTNSASSNTANHEGPDDNDIYCLCRPRFSLFDYYCRGVLENLTMQETLVSFPRYQRSIDHPRYNIIEHPSSSAGPIATGMELVNDTKFMASLSEVRVRGKDHAKVQLQHADNNQQKIDPQFPINNVFFPLLASLLPRWESMIADKQYRPSEAVKRVLILVTGVGTPRNWTHSVSGNSTQACADLMERFVRKIDPTITVVKIHSETNIFRYDENLVFVQQELLPVLHSYRDAHARGLPYPDEIQPMVSPVVAAETPFDVDWRNSLSVSLSLADGSPARTYAIQAGLRPYRPTFMHFWQLKTFWHESKIVDDDLEVYAFEAMETSPAVDIQDLTDQELQLVVDEMMKFKDEMLDTLKNGHGDIKKFWLRKTHKPVLAVLLVQNPSDPNGPPILYRGTNMEVSMPTGSLCAERNVIGTALAANPNLKREHLKMVAVLAVPPPSDDPLAVSAPPSTNASVAAVADSEMKRVNSIASFGGTTFAGSTSDLNYFHDRKISIGSEADDCMPSSAAGSVSGPQSTLSSSRHMSFEIPIQQQQAIEQEGESNPMRKIDLYPSIKKTNSMDGNAVSSAAAAATPTRKNRKKSIVVLQSSRDLNPLKPCGACNEWLKKIAECNPYFQVVTFTDANCNGIYCMPCQE